MQTDLRRARDRYFTRAQALRDQRRTDISKLARAMSPDEWTQVDRGTVRAALLGRRGGQATALPARETVEALDQALHAGGELVALWRDAVVEETAIRIGIPPSGLLPVESATVRRAEEARATDRRQALFAATGLSAAAIISTTTGVHQAIAATSGELLTVTDLEHALDELTRDLWVVDPGTLFRQAYADWERCEELLSGRLRPDAARRLTLTAGRFASRLATLARYLGDTQIPRHFAAIAEQHADALRDPLLIGEVAGLQSRIAFDASDFSTAADHAARGRELAHPGQRARLAAYEAEAASAAGLGPRASAAVAAMREGMSAATRGGNALGWNGAEEDLYTAVTAANTPGAGLAAIHHGERAAAAFIDDWQGVGLAHLAQATGYLTIEKPRPDAAAVAGIEAMGALARCTNAVVRTRLHALAVDLEPWAADAAVRDFRSRVPRAA